MRKVLFISGIVLFSLFLLLWISAWAITRFFADDIKELLLDRLNSQLTTEVSAEGPAKISLFRYFPDAELKITGIRLQGAAGDSLPLAEAGEISLRVNLWQLLRKNYRVSEVSLSDAVFNLLVDSQGRVNYEVFRSGESSDTTGTGSRFDFVLRAARLQRVAFNYLNEENGLSASGQVAEGRLSGMFSGDSLNLHTELSLEMAHIRVDGQEYFNDQSASLEATFLAGLASERYFLRDGILTMDNGRYRFEGNYAANRPGAFRLEGEEVNLADLLALAPQQVHEALDGWDSRGQLAFTAQVGFPGSGSGFPDIRADISLSDGEIFYREVHQGFEAVNFEATLRASADQGPEGLIFEVPAFRAEFDGEPIRFSFYLKNLDNPRTRTTLTCNLDLEPFARWLATFGLREPEGRIIADNLRLLADQDGLRHGLSNAFVSSGTLQLEEVGFDYLGKPFSHFNGTLNFSGTTIRTDSLPGEIGNSELVWSGSLDQWAPRLLAGNESQPLKLNGRLRFQTLDLDDLLTWESETQEDTDRTDTAYNYLSSFTRFSGPLVIHCREMNYEDFYAKNIYSRVDLSPQEIGIDTLDALATDGRISGHGYLKVLDGEVLKGRFQVQTHDIDMEQAFREFDNFGQEVVTDRMISGRLTAGVDASVYWDPMLNLLDDRLEMQANVRVDNGRLRNCEPLTELSAFVKLKELEDIRFNELENTILIRNRTVIIPAMIVRSTALNLLMCGEHHFDNRIGYYFKVNLLDLLARKFRFGKIELEETEEVREGPINIYVAMRGTASDPVVETDKKAVKERLYTDYYGPSNIRDKIRQYQVESERIDWSPGAETDSLEFIDW